jgi:hypothetical protein
VRFNEQVRASSLYRIVGGAAGGALARAGFEPAGKRTWVRSTKGPIRELIAAVPPRWACSLYWGFSLDFVPVVSYRFDYAIRPKADDVRWWPDLTYHPLDYFWGDRDAWMIPATEGRAKAVAAADVVLGHVLCESAKFFDPVSSIADLPAAFEAKRWRQPSRDSGTGAGLHGQELLAYALTLAKLGRRDEGVVWLSQFKTTGILMPRTTKRALDVLFEQTYSNGT